MRYTLRQLEYFVAAAELGSITLASEQVHISQPSISVAISHLEREFGVQLFIRHHAQGLSLTSAGRTVLREAKSLLAQANGLYLSVSEAQGKVVGTLSLGCMTTIAPMIAPELAHAFRTAYPEVEIRHVADHQEQLLRGLRQSELDVAITYDLEIPDEVLFTPLAHLPPHIVLSEDHPLATAEILDLETMAFEPLILLDLPLSRDYLLGLFSAHGLQPHVGTRSAHQEVVRTMVANGYGYTLFNTRPRSDYALDGRQVVRIPLSGSHRPMVIGTARLRSVVPSQLILAFEEHCRTAITDSRIPGMTGAIPSRAR